MLDTDTEIAMNCRTWAFEEAKAVLKKLGGKTPAKGYVLFETGYGPSGLPHIGTFGENCRTTMVMRAFRRLSDIPAKMICFSDDMDGLRKVPDNVPNPDVLAANLGQPLTKVPNPFDTKFKSFGEHNNSRLQEFLSQFGFEYEFVSATDYYKAGKFDATLLKMLAKHEEIKKAVLPILGEERAATYSPFLPVSPKTGKVLQVPITSVDVAKGTVSFIDEDGTPTEVPVTGGNVKAQWRADWALRWYTLDVDYEMAGKDLVSAADISSKIVRILGSTPPVGFRYELFLDEKGEKISKSKGNGLTMEEWLKYAPHESLAYYMFQRPTSAKKLYFDVIPKAVDEYITFVEKLPSQDDKAKLDNPVWYIHDGKLPNGQHSPVSFGLLLNLASACNAHNAETMWGFIRNYNPDVTPDSAPFLERLVGYAVKYYEDFVLPNKQYRAPDGRERQALENLAYRLEQLPKNATFDMLQTEVFSAGKENGYEKEELRTWFGALYQVLLGQNEGPRFGSFIQLYGIEQTIALIHKGLNGDLAKAA